MILKRAPLLAAVLLIWILLSALALLGRGRGYRAYKEDFGRHPAVSVVMRGIHDHVFPWSKTDGEETAGDSGEAKTGDTEKNEETQEAGSEEIGRTEESAGQDASLKNETKKETKKETKEETGESSSEDKAAKQETDSEKNKEEDKEKDKEKETGTEDKKEETKTWTIPETTCSKVVGAKDYGVAEDRYLSPKGTSFNTDKEGLFAPDGVFYNLQKVDDKYFADALFVGDSRTVGLYEYGDMASATSFLARESTTIYDLFDDSEIMDYTPRGKKTTERTLRDLLSKAKFRKIYLSVGVNELGIPDTEDYYKEYRKVVRRINKLQPEAIIYIQGIMHVSKAKSSSDPVFNNTAIVQRNKAIATLANGRNIFYIDMNGDLCDKNGDLRDELTGDGIHLKASACSLWHTFLLEHAIVVPD